MLRLQLIVLLNVFRRSLVLGDAGIDEFLPLVALELALHITAVRFCFLTQRGEISGTEWRHIPAHQTCLAF
jgi:hypothetical protein